jgi:hypothetical protein
MFVTNYNFIYLKFQLIIKKGKQDNLNIEPIEKTALSSAFLFEEKQDKNIHEC